MKKYNCVNTNYANITIRNIIDKLISLSEEIQIDIEKLFQMFLLLLESELTKAVTK